MLSGERRLASEEKFTLYLHNEICNIYRLFTTIPYNMNPTLLFSPGPVEIIIIVLVILLLFGGRKIPELMRGLGRGMKEFKNAQKEDAEDDNKPEKEGRDKEA